MHIFIVKVYFLERFYWHRNNPLTENYLLLLPTPHPLIKIVFNQSPCDCNWTQPAGKSMLFAKHTSEKLEPTVGRLFLRVSMLEYTF